MAETNHRGPIGSLGSLEGDANATVASIQPMDGPSYFYQGVAIADPRGYPIAKDGLLPGRVAAFLNNANMVTLDVVPQIAASTVLVTGLAAVTTGANLPLNTAPGVPGGTTAAQLALGVPMIPQGTTVATSVMAIDFGFTVGTTTAGTTVTVPDNTLFYVGQWIIIGNVANVSGTASLVTQVQSIGTTVAGQTSTSNYTTLTVSPSPLTALFAPIGNANLYGSALIALGSQFGPVNSSATAVNKNVVAGVTKLHNPREQSARCVSVAAVSSAGGTGVFLVTGYDVWQMLMTEKLTASGTTVIYGNKAFKYIQSINAVATGVATVSFGIGDTFGFPIRCDEWQQLEAFAGNTAIQNNVGVTVAATTNPATNTTGDVRGTIQISAAGSGTPISATVASNGTSRLVVYQNPAVDRVASCTPNNPLPLFGMTQSTT